jgi:hypothetical protein
LANFPPKYTVSLIFCLNLDDTVEQGRPEGGGGAAPPMFLAFGKIFAKGDIFRQKFCKIARYLAKFLISAENLA